MRDTRTDTPMLRGLSSIAGIVGGFSTFAAAVLGFWAFFFTDIAEEVTKRLNTEVASLNEELVDLRRERRSLETQALELSVQRAEALREAEVQVRSHNNHLAALRDDIASVEGERDAMIGEIESLRSEAEELETDRDAAVKELSSARDELLALSAERARGIAELAAHKVETASVLLGKLRLFEYEEEAAKASNIARYASWRDRYDRVSTMDRKTLEGANAWRSEMGRLFEDQPERWASDDDIAAFRDHLANRDRLETGMDYARAVLLRERTYVEFSPEDNERVLGAIVEVLRENRDVLSREIVVVIPRGESHASVAAAGDKVRRNIKDIADLMETVHLEVRDILMR